MRSTNIVLALGVVLFGSSSAGAQSFLDRVVIRQDLNTKNSVPQPAFFQVTVAEGKATTVSAGIGIIANLVDRPTLSVGPSFEYLKDTSLSKPVDSLKAGASFEWQTRAFNVSQSAIDNSPVINGKIAYARDGVKTTDGIQALVTYTHFFVGQHKAWLPNNEHLFHPQLSMMYSPSAGFEFDRASSGPAVDAGQAIRLVLSLTLAAYPLRAMTEEHLELTASLSSRSDLQKSFTSYDGRQHTLLTLASTYYFLKESKRTAGIGVTFVDGEDPSKGFAQQRSVQIGLRLQMK